MVALALITSPLLAMDNDAFAIKKKKGDNVAQQAIDQSQSSIQNAFCVSGSRTLCRVITLAFKTKRIHEITH